MRQYINLETIELVAEGLRELREKMVFVGGAVLGLYADELSADPVRMTKDIDLTIELANLGHWAALQERLAELGFFPSPEEQVICRYQYKGIQVDIMPASDSHFGPSNVWYLPGFQYTIPFVLRNGLSIRLLSMPYFLSTKFTALHSRGGDPRSSHDFEDIIFLTDNSSNLPAVILEADP
ncbi:MAG: nucleotidyl transferase AbiEii/AbiGii toxin family protein, partial [Phycisphaerales bacterium]|nr:nucleotidyl transferase AbiEii/AbiGii toxin family protein [Phycisphaerales bacterium]